MWLVLLTGRQQHGVRLDGSTQQRGTSIHRICFVDKSAVAERSQPDPNSWTENDVDRLRQSSRSLVVTSLYENGRWED